MGWVDGVIWIAGFIGICWGAGRILERLGRRWQPASAEKPYGGETFVAGLLIIMVLGTAAMFISNGVHHFF